MVDPLNLTSARFRLGLENGPSLKKFAEEYLAAGHEEPSLVQLAVLDEDGLADVAPAFEAACRQLRHEVPSMGDAIPIAVAGALSDIVTGKVEPHAGLRELRVIYGKVWPLETPDPSVPEQAEMLGGEFGLSDLLGAYYGYDDIRERPTEVSFEDKFGAEALEALDQFVVAKSKEWLESDLNRVATDSSRGPNGDQTQSN